MFLKRYKINCIFSNRIVIFCYCLLFYINIYSQQSFLKGFVQDSLSGERLIGVNVYNHSLSKGTVTNEFGYFSIPYNTKMVQELQI